MARKRLRGLYRDIRRVFYPHLSVKAFFAPSVFIKDTQKEKFQCFLKHFQNKLPYNGALILGNGASLNLLTNEALKKFQNNGYLLIGLNRTIYKFITDILIWSDVETLYAILGKESLIRNDSRRHPMHVVQAVLEVGKPFQRIIDKWSMEQSFDAFPQTKLFMFRTVLTAAFHLCYILGIKKILLAGVDFDTRRYFYETDLYSPDQPYELRLEKSIETHFRGYSTHRIVKEVIESLITKHGFEISYLGDSQFLRTVEGLRKNGSTLPFEDLAT